ncbi:T9SS type A sorting domain-containing protein [Psychroflexus tropicus]|uniref:T9SS type A sorting domain-containing protein n=1 Tax=Psychroflexus tropicus TaxID=197345 RepID=UPI000378E4E0|nr:T9SS type A sorting domain-containing protein [Psychroflexus tropicus]
MKTFKFLLFTLIVYSFQTKAQTQDLLDNTWYLEKVVIVGDDIFVPSLGSTPIAYAEFNSDFLFTEYCNSLFADIQYSDNMNFTLSGQGLTFEGCFVEEYDAFDTIYYNNFFGFVEGFFQPFTYEITQESFTLKKLTITNTNGDQAVYFSQTLSIQDENEFASVQLYPNPAQNKFSIESDLSIEQVKIYTLTGKVVAKFHSEPKSSTYDISFLLSGIYFVEVTSLEGKKTVTKLIKN